jgi:hypothetical protein
MRERVERGGGREKEGEAKTPLVTGEVAWFELRS